MALQTRFTARFGLTHPVALAPMAGASGGRLAGAVARAGGLALLGGGYCDADWIDREWALAEGARNAVERGSPVVLVAQSQAMLHPALKALSPRMSSDRLRLCATWALYPSTPTFRL